jgi:hypothetical protein
MATKKTGSLKGVDVVLVTSVNLAASDVTGVLPVANGGNGTGSFTDGQILIGNTTGNTLTKTTLTGTSNQVVVTNGAGAITLSLPQSIATTSSPTFGGAVLSGATPYLQWTSTGAVNWYLQAGVSPTAASSGNYLTAAVPAGKGMAVAQSGSGTLFLMDAGGNVSFGTGSTTPLAKCESRTTSGPQFIASYDATNYYSETVSSAGAVVMATTGTNASITLTPSGTGKIILSAIPRFNGTNSTGAGSSLLGANSPATTLTAPYTWISVITSDGSTAYVPCWK